MNAKPVRPPILPARTFETDAEHRLRSALNRTCGQAIAALDAAIQMRTAPQQAQKMRHLANAALVDFCGKAMLALAFAEEEPPPPTQQGD